MQSENGDVSYAKLYEILSESRNEDLDERTAPDHLRLEEDLGIYGDDAVEFLLAIGDAYKLDLSEFEITLYFTQEGGNFLDLLFFRKEKKQRLSPTLGELKEAIRTGKLR